MATLKNVDKTNKMLDQKGTEKGSTKAITQHKAISDGYAADDFPARVSLSQKKFTKTGDEEVPGFTSMGKMTSKIASKNSKGAKGYESTPIKKKK